MTLDEVVKAHRLIEKRRRLQEDLKQPVFSQLAGSSSAHFHYSQYSVTSRVPSLLADMRVVAVRAIERELEQTEKELKAAGVEFVDG